MSLGPNRKPRVLIVHSAPHAASELSTALGGDLETLFAVSQEEAWNHLNGRCVELVVAEEKFGVGLLDELSHRAPGVPRAILFAGQDRVPWLEAAAEGHVFAGIPEDSPNAIARLRSLVRAQDELRPLLGSTVEAATEDGRAVVTGSLLRLGNESITFRVEPGEALEAFLPGRELERVAVRRGREPVLEASGAAIVALRPDASGGYEVETALAAPPPPQGDEVVRDPLQRASLVGEALRRSRLVVRPACALGAPRVVQGRVEPAADLLLVDPAPDGFAAGMPVRFAFEAGGVHYEFFSALAKAPAAVGNGLSAALPDELRGRRRRRPRIPLAPGEASAELTTSLRREPVRRAVTDVELEGMGVLAERADLLPVGTRLGGIRVDLADGVTLRATGRITSRAPPSGPDGGQVRCGVRFDPLALEDRSALAAAILRRTHPGLEVARGLTFDALWCFLRECGFLYPEKEERLRPVLPEIARTLRAALSRPDGPLRTLIFRSEGLLQGHLSALRAYRRTWIVQHLAARKEGPGKLEAAKALSVGIMDYLEQLPDAEWLRSWFRPQNRFPARTFGRFARLQFDPHRCDVRTYGYLTAPAADFPPPPPDVAVSAATAADWAELRRHLVSSGRIAQLAAEDLCSAPHLVEIDEEYGAAGLGRRREALVARRGGRMLGFALLEISSIGLNFSELTNAFRLHAVEPDPAATTALAIAARRRCAELGRPFAIGLAERPDLAAWGAAGFELAKEYSCWTLHRSLFRRYADYVERLYEHRARGHRRAR